MGVGSQKRITREIKIGVHIGCDLSLRDDKGLGKLVPRLYKLGLACFVADFSILSQAKLSQDQENYPLVSAQEQLL